MKKILVISILIILALAIGCSTKQEKTLVSRPVMKDSAQDPMYTIEPAKEEMPKQEVPVQTTPTTTTETKTEPKTATSSCDVLSGTEVAGIMGGAYTKFKNCPVHPQMPKGVTVCQCGYEWKTNFIDVEVQTYTDGSEGRVFNMYCSTTNTAVGDKACTWKSPGGVENVYFLKGNKFVKVSCRGLCEQTNLVNLAKSLENKI